MPTDSERPGKLRLDLFDALGDPLGERVDIILRNQTLSDVVAVRGVMVNKPVVVSNLLAAPQGLYRMFIDPPSFLPVHVFVNIEAGRVTNRELAFAIDPEKVLRVDFPGWDAVDYAHTVLRASGNVLGFAGKSGEALYTALDDIRRAGLLNILAKSRRTMLANSSVVLEHVKEIREVRGDRFFAMVPKELREDVKNSIAAGLFQEVSGALHRPPDGFSPAGSFKTPDSYGNLQLTFFASPSEWMADIDIDDANGLEHVFQVMRNALTGRPTHPYDIRDILLRHQEIDPGYRFILRDEPKAIPAGRGA